MPASTRYALKWATKAPLPTVSGKERNTLVREAGQSEGNSCLDEPPRLASGPGDCGSTQRKDGRSVAHGLEFLYRACSHASLSFGLHAVQVAWLVGLRNGCPRGYGLPYDQFGFHGLRIDPTLFDRVRQHGPDQRRDFSFMGQH